MIKKSQLTRAQTTTGTNAKVEKPKLYMMNCWRLTMNKAERETPEDPVIEAPHTFVNFASKSSTIFSTVRTGIGERFPCVSGTGRGKKSF